MYKKFKLKLINNFHSPKKGMGVIEFLISVLLIAILSAITIPVFVNKTNISSNKFNNNTTTNNINNLAKPSINSENSYKDESFKQLYKIAYSEVSQCWKQLYTEGGLSARQGWVSDQANSNNFTQFMNKFNTIKQCNYPNNSDCWAQNETSEVLSGHPSSLGDRCFIDSSGRAWCEAASWGWFSVDVNGFKEPNQFGKDRFIFYTIAGNDITASGTPDNIIYDSDYTSFDANKCPNPPCYYTSWISGN